MLSSSTTHHQFKVGDKVRVDLDVEILKAMQEGHGGWNPRMADVRIQKLIVYLIFLFTVIFGVIILDL